MAENGTPRRQGCGDHGSRRACITGSRGRHPVLQRGSVCVCVADVGASKPARRRQPTAKQAVRSVKADVSDPKSVQAMYAETAKRYGRIDILYNNAGIMPADDDSILTTEPDAWDRVRPGGQRERRFPVLQVRDPTPARSAGGGSVINVASFVAASGWAPPLRRSAYTASKGAVLSMSRELAVQFARQGVRVNALCPGPVETPLLMRLFADDAWQRTRAAPHPSPDGAPCHRAREIANAALFLASDESSYVNGATFLVDGGLSAAYGHAWR